jgi:dephospho-CoA kinase
VYLIGLTGGIASGKSTVAARLADHGAVVIDADELARRAVEPGTAGLAGIRREFGRQVIAADGSLDRGALGAIVFADAGRRERLNRIVHPAIKQLACSLIARAAEADPHAIVVYAVPLLVEAGAAADRDFARVVVVHADAETRLRRLVEQRGLTRAEAMHRLNSQATDAERLAVADLVIDNDGPREHALGQADALWERVRQRAGRDDGA